LIAQPDDQISKREEVRIMYEFTKKAVDENAMNVALYTENGGACKNQGICGDVDGVCGV
jgi:hypothetical protein